MKKSKFIPVFVEVLKEFSDFLTITFSRDTLGNKIIRMGGINPKEFYKGLDNLKHRQILRFSYGGKWGFTKKGRGWVKEARIRYFSLKKKNWDKKWRVIIFDIPEELHRKRNIFRKKLKNLDFYPLQKSVFIMPYPCEEELGDLCFDLSITDYVDIITAEKIGFKENEIKKYYKL